MLEAIQRVWTIAPNCNFSSPERIELKILIHPRDETSIVKFR